mgnify:CR=1 FL=1
MIKPIETQYAGYRFRSRLEARYAVFFDALGAAWEYEPEGYDLGYAGLYLPDFRLPRLGVHVEVKPPFVDVSPDLRAKMVAFRDGVGPIVLCQGLPTPAWCSILYCHDIAESSAGGYENACGWAWCMHCGALTIAVTDNDAQLLRGDRSLYADAEMSELLSITACNHTRGQHLIGPIIDAGTVARSARFEHGDTGNYHNWAVPHP